MPKLNVNGLDFHYWQVGQGPDVVMIHGLSGNLAVWHLKVVPGLRSTHRVTTFDLRGHGKSSMPPTGYTTRDMASDLLGIMDALGIERAHLVGHSLGTDIALHFALLHPDRVLKIVAIEAGIAALANERKREEWTGWAYWAEMLEKHAGIQVPREKWHDVTHMLRESLKAPILFGPARGLPRKSEKLLRLVETTTLIHDYENSAGMTLDALGRISPPVMLVYGSNSQYLGTYDVLNEALPDCETLLLDDCEHFGPLERPDELLVRMRGFFGGFPVGREAGS
jgi:pimeloyl-ACP methyl ester carboxylesterase